MRTDLHVFVNGTVNARRYRDEIHGPHVIPFAGAICQKFMFMDDNATPHRARIVHQHFYDKGVAHMERSARPTDINIIEHASDMPHRRVSARQHQPSTRNEVVAALTEEWGLIRQMDVKMFIRSYRASAREVFRALGGHTCF